MFTARFVDGPRKGQEDMIFGRQPTEGERVYYMRFGVQGWVRVLESWSIEDGCVIYELKLDDTVSVGEAGGAGHHQGIAYYKFVEEVGGGLGPQSG